MRKWILCSQQYPRSFFSFSLPFLFLFIIVSFFLFLLLSLSLCFAPSVGPSVRNERWPLIRQKILLYRADPLSTKWKRSADESGLVSFAPLLDVAHRLELNRFDGLSVEEGSCMANSCQFLLTSSCVLFPLSPSRSLLFASPLVLFGTIGGMEVDKLSSANDFALEMALLTWISNDLKRSTRSSWIRSFLDGFQIFIYSEYGIWGCARWFNSNRSWLWFRRIRERFSLVRTVCT